MQITIHSLFRTVSFALLVGALWSSPVAAEKGCLDCHGDDMPAQTLAHRAHGQGADPRIPEGDAMCQNCHGPSDDHKAEPRKTLPDRMFGKDSNLAAEERTEVCTNCHNTGHQKNWLISEHASDDVACDSCHNVHALKDPVQEKLTQGEVCLGCHVDQKANALKFSRHPIKEGIVACSDCHDPHGGKGPSMLAESTVNETCYQCHTEKRGPLLFEHEPVQDDCTNCHTPHGSVNDNMLITRAPLLCQQCHIASRHPGQNRIREDQFDPDGLGDTRLIGKSCLNCHGQVHGTNHPAGMTFRN